MARRITPRIDHVDRQVLEMARVAGGDSRVACDRDAGDKGVAQIARTARSLAPCAENGRLDGSGFVQRQNTPRKANRG
jgi:hypothetical protein